MFNGSNSRTVLAEAAEKYGWEAKPLTFHGTCAIFIGPSGLQVTVWFDDADRIRKAFVGDTKITGGAKGIVDLMKGMAS